jgi:RimJ/RimL family protein N-acetyltransferase
VSPPPPVPPFDHDLQLSYRLPDGRVARVEFVEEADAVRVLDHLEQLAGESDYLTFGPGELGLAVEQEVAYITALRDSGSGFILKAEVDGALAAFASLKRTPRPRIAHVGEFGLAVARAFWGMGLGRLLSEATIAQARTLGVTRIELRVRADNTRARGLYERLGFEVVGRAARGFRVGASYYDEILMGLEVGDG